MSDLVVAMLTGGEGGAKLALGICGLVPERPLSLIVNASGDFGHLGLRICRDLDTEVKAPAARIMAELGLEPAPLAVDRHYDGMIDGVLPDARDAALKTQISGPASVTDTRMQTLDEKRCVARAVRNFAQHLAGGRR